MICVCVCVCMRAGECVHVCTCKIMFWICDVKWWFSCDQNQICCFCYIICNCLFAEPLLPPKGKLAVLSSASSVVSSDSSSHSGSDTGKRPTRPARLGSHSELDADSSEEMVGGYLHVHICHTRKKNFGPLHLNGRAWHKLDWVRQYVWRLSTKSNCH